MFIDELDEAERTLLKLRLDLGLDPPEIRQRLGLTDRQYRRTAERAGKSCSLSSGPSIGASGRAASAASCAPV